MAGRAPPPIPVPGASVWDDDGSARDARRDAPGMGDGWDWYPAATASSATARHQEPPASAMRSWGPSAAVLAPILALSAFLQFYRLDDLQHFQGDQGILVLAARALIVDHVFPVYGLALAVGSAHIGPLFDYLIAIPLRLSGLNPTAAVALNGGCQVLAVALCYGLLVRVGAGRLAGLVAALVQATAQEVVYYSRFLWPNMLPCVMLLILWSALALRDGRRYHLALLGVWLAVALQLQPTAVLLVPFLALYLALFRPALSWRYAALGALACALLFAPSIIHDATHGLVETRAWLDYRQGGTPRDRAIGHTLARLAVLLQRLLGIQQAPLAAALGAVLALGTLARALRPASMVADAGRSGSPVWTGGAIADGLQPASRPRDDGHAASSVADLCRLLALLCAVCACGYLFFGSQLRPHYLMPLFPVPALAIGALAAPWRHRGGLRRALGAVWRAGVVAVALALAASNVAHTWQAGFLPDRYQITLQAGGSNRITLGQMRQVGQFILGEAGDRHFNLLFIAPDDQPFAYQALLLGGGGHLGFRPAALRFLVVQPPDWRMDRWPSWARRLALCGSAPPRRFAAALVWTLRGAATCPVAPHGRSPTRRPPSHPAPHP